MKTHLSLLSTLAFVFSFTACGSNESRFSEQINEGSGGDVDLVIGQAVYENNCLACHGSTGGNGFAPDVRNSSASEIQSIVRTGQGSMPGYSPAQISDTELNHLIGYIATL